VCTTHAQKRFTISEVAADWHELTQCVMQASTAIRMNQAYLVIDGIKLGENDAINEMRIRVGGGVISKSLVELHQLIDGFIANKCFTNKQNQVWLIHLQANTDKISNHMNKNANKNSI